MGWGGVLLKFDAQDQGAGKNLDGQGRWWVLKIRQFSWASYMYHP